jgi:hypothetical protein
MFFHAGAAKHFICLCNPFSLPWTRPGQSTPVHNTMTLDTNAHMHELTKPNLSCEWVSPPYEVLPRKMQILEMEAIRHTLTRSTFCRFCTMPHDSSARTLYAVFRTMTTLPLMPWQFSHRDQITMQPKPAPTSRSPQHAPQSSKRTASHCPRFLSLRSRPPSGVKCGEEEAHAQEVMRLE